MFVKWKLSEIYMAWIESPVIPLVLNDGCGTCVLQALILVMENLEVQVHEVHWVGWLFTSVDSSVVIEN